MAITLLIKIIIGSAVAVGSTVTTLGIVYKKEVKKWFTSTSSEEDGSLGILQSQTAGGKVVVFDTTESVEEGGHAEPEKLPGSIDSGAQSSDEEEFKPGKQPEPETLEQGGNESATLLESTPSTTEGQTENESLSNKDTIESETSQQANEQTQAQVTKADAPKANTAAAEG